MKTLIQIVLVALIIGGASAGGSFYWHQKLLKLAEAQKELLAAEEKIKEAKKQEARDSEALEDVETEDAEADHEMADAEEPVPSKPVKPPVEMAEHFPAPTSFGPPAGVRPPWDKHGDEAGDLINTLRARAASTTRQERRVAEREDAMNLIFEDLRVEQANSANVRRRLLDESNVAFQNAEQARKATASERNALYRATEVERTKMKEQQAEERRIAEEEIQKLNREKEEAALAADNAMKAILEEQEELRRQLEVARNPPEVPDRSGSEEETANLKKLITVFDSMPVENTAKALQESVEKGQIDAVVAVLNGLKPKKSADVLSLIQQSKPSLVTDLLERLKRFKKGGDSKPAKK